MIGIDPILNTSLGSIFLDVGDTFIDISEILNAQVILLSFGNHGSLLILQFLEVGKWVDQVSISVDFSSPDCSGILVTRKLVCLHVEIFSVVFNVVVVRLLVVDVQFTSATILCDWDVLDVSVCQLSELLWSTLFLPDSIDVSLHGLLQLLDLSNSFGVINNISLVDFFLIRSSSLLWSGGKLFLLGLKLFHVGSWSKEIRVLDDSCSPSSSGGNVVRLLVCWMVEIIDVVFDVCVVLSLIGWVKVLGTFLVDLDGLGLIILVLVASVKSWVANLFPVNIDSMLCRSMIFECLKEFKSFLDFLDGVSMDFLSFTSLLTLSF